MDALTGMLGGGGIDIGQLADTFAAAQQFQLQLLELNSKHDMIMNGLQALQNAFNDIQG